MYHSFDHSFLQTWVLGATQSSPTNNDALLYIKMPLESSALYIGPLIIMWPPSPEATPYIRPQFKRTNRV